MEEILIISNYYPPEKGAAANRIEQLALKLDQNKYTVTVICPLGNYPKGKLFPEYKGKFSVTFPDKNITKRINELIKYVKKAEVRRVGKPSNVKKSITMALFRMGLKLLERKKRGN